MPADFIREYADLIASLDFDRDYSLDNFRWYTVRQAIEAETRVTGGAINLNSDGSANFGGNVGIGTNNAADKLHLSNNDQLWIRLQRTGDSPSTCYLGNSGNLFSFRNNSNGY